ncbi:MAG: putative metal-binding motif-containing protein, partial [Saprospiraceae bacterium]|nr:putative metal-binding motif-containing protein [Saprospiraceae bacterium]
MDQTITNNWPGFRDRIIASTDEAIYFRMNESTDLKLYFSDGTNTNTVATNYTFTGGTSGTDVVYKSVEGGNIAFGIGGSLSSSNYDIILFKNNSSSFTTVETGLKDLEGITLLNNVLYYAASKTTGVNSNKIYAHDLSTGATTVLASFDNAGIKGLCTSNGDIMAMGFIGGQNKLVKVDHTTGAFTDIYSFTLNPQFHKYVNMTPSGNKVFFWYQNGNSVYSLYVTDGTSNGTLPLIDSLTNLDDFLYYAERTVLAADGKIIFSGRKVSDSFLTERLFYSDGTPQNSKQINIDNTADIDPIDFVYDNQSCYFTGLTAGGSSLIKFDGTNAQVLASSNARGLVKYNGKLFTSAEPGNDGQELYYFNPQAGALELAYNIVSFSADSSPRYFHTINNKLIFVANSDFIGNRKLMVYEEGAVLDNDNDGYTSDIDCNDTNASINPGATEIPNNDI